jgi:AcrR family transcriptional regulator
MAVAKVRTPRGEWIKAGLQALAEGGPDAVRVEALAARLGVSKGGFYWHFADRSALLERVLDEWERTLVDDVITQVDHDATEPSARLQRLFDLADVFAKTEYGPALELTIRDWARRDKAVAKRLRRVDSRRMAYLRSLFRELGLPDDEAEARSLLAFALFVGNPLISADHDGMTRRDVVGKALDSLLTDPRPAAIPRRRR